MSPLAAFTTVARRLALCCYRSEKRHFEFAFVFKEPAIVHAYSAKTKQCEFVDVRGDDDECAVCSKDDGFACWEQ